MPPPRKPIGNYDRRDSDRHETHFNASVVQGSVPQNVELMDISRTGARIRIRHGLMPLAGDRVRLNLMAGPSICASVIWSSDYECGLEFSLPFDSVEDTLHFDDLGADFYHRLASLQLVNNT